MCTVLLDEWWEAMMRLTDEEENGWWGHKDTEHTQGGGCISDLGKSPAMLAGGQSRTTTKGD